MLTTKLTRHVLLFACIFFFITIRSLCAREIHKNSVINHTIEIELLLKEHRLKAVDHMTVQCVNAEKVSCILNKSFRVLSVSALNRPLDFKTTSTAGVLHLEILLPSDLWQSDSMVLDIEYEGFLSGKPGSLEKENLGETTGTIGEEGVYLSPACMWYPERPSSLATFQVAIITPAEYEAVTQGTLTGKKTVDQKTYTTWEEKNVSEGCHLVAGRYKVTNIKHNDIDIYAFFFPEEQGLAETYLTATKRYLDMYQNLLGNYPYKKFAIVENFFQTGYGMPSFTLLGRAVVKLPFIVEISLGHEILHNWWGNSVFVDESQGNWCEGLTTYMADYYYKELSGDAEASTYRKNICRKYTSYVTSQNDFPLKDFIGRRDQTTQAVGYGKTAMVFHMLRQIVGDELFFQSLKKFYKEKIWQQAGWKDIQYIFEKTCKREFSWFFEQWIDREGAPFVTLGKTQSEKNSDGWLTTVEIIQKDKPYHLFLPIHLELDDSNFTTIAEIKESLNHISIQTKSRPGHIAIDPQCNVFRRLHTEEIPPALDLVLGDKDRIIVYPTGGESSLQAGYKELAEFLNDNNGVVKADTEVTASELTQNSLFILGGLSENKLTKIFLENSSGNFHLEETSFTLNNVTYENKGNAILITTRNFKNRAKNLALFIGLSPDAIKSAGFKITHYGKYSYLVFNNGKNIDKGIFEATGNPLQRYLKD